MDNFFVQLQGVASNIVLQRIRHQAKFVIEENNKYTSFLFLNYSNFDIPVGSEFLYFIELNEDETIISIAAKIRLVTQEYLLPFDYIPKGHKTLCSISFDKAGFEQVTSSVPVVDSWQDSEKIFLLSNTKDRIWKEYFG